MGSEAARPGPEGPNRRSVVGARLHVIVASHPCACVDAALGIKAVPYRRVELPTLVHRPIQRLRYGAPTVPGLTLEDGEKMVGSVPILRRLEELAPDPPLYPADAALRERVERSEVWGDEVLQNAVRRIELALLRRRPSAVVSYSQDSAFPIPRWLIRANAPLVVRVYGRLVGASDEAARADVAALPGYLDHVDELIAEGTIGGEHPNAADLQIGASVRQLSTIADLQQLLADRPALALARHFPPMAGHMPAGTTPSSWLPET